MIRTIMIVAFVLLGWFVSPIHGQDKTDFAHDVLPILKKRCASCHSNGTYKGGFTIDTRESIVDSGTVDLDKPEESDLIQRIRSRDPDYQMPPTGNRLSDQQVLALTKWIRDDLAWEPGFSFKASNWDPPIKPVRVEIPSSPKNPIDVVLEKYYFEPEQPQPNSIVADGLFIRRAFMDIIGVLPTLEEQAAFFENEDRDGKRAALVQQLLARDRQFADHWLTFWNDLLRNDYAGTGYIDGGRKQITKWLHKSLLENKPYDQFVRELIAPTPESEGFIRGIKWRGNVNASQITEVQFAQNVSQVFLGENLKCASCHDSFIDDWKLTDAYGMAAIIADKPLEMFRCDIPTGNTARAAFLWPQLGTIDPDLPKNKRLAKTAEILTGPKNGRFTRTIVNRIWHRMMGQGIVEPVDMMSNRPFSPELLNYLAVYLADNDYDLKKLIRLIATSSAYQSRSVQRDNGESRERWNGPNVRRLTAEQFVDAVWQLTESGPKKPNAPIDLPANNPDPSPRIRASLVACDQLMRSLGRPNREQVVTTRPDQISTLQALDLSNGKPLFDLINQGAKNHLQSAKSNPAKYAKTFFLKALCRMPSRSELDVLTEVLGDNPTTESIADMTWTVFMMPEFQYVR